MTVTPAHFTMENAQAFTTSFATQRSLTSIYVEDSSCHALPNPREHMWFIIYEQRHWPACIIPFLPLTDAEGVHWPDNNHCFGHISPSLWSSFATHISILRTHAHSASFTDQEVRDGVHHAVRPLASAEAFTGLITFVVAAFNRLGHHGTRHNDDIESTEGQRRTHCFLSRTKPFL